MIDLGDAFRSAAHLILTFDTDLVEIVLRSLRVTLMAVAIAALIGLPFGAALALFRFPGRRLILISLDTLMGLPPVAVGLLVYLMLSRAGPLGALGLLFTTTAMVIAQCLLVTPIIAALTRQTIEDLWEEYRDELRSLGASTSSAVGTLLWEGRVTLLTAMLAGFGRASAEVGAVMIVGGNIDHVTRVMTTTIALETSKGNLALALGLGIILISVSLVIAGSIHAIKGTARKLGA